MRLWMCLWLCTYASVCLCCIRAANRLSWSAEHGVLRAWSRLIDTSRESPPRLSLSSTRFSIMFPLRFPGCLSGTVFVSRVNNSPRIRVHGLLYVQCPYSLYGPTCISADGVQSTILFLSSVGRKKERRRLCVDLLHRSDIYLCECRISTSVYIGIDLGQ